MPSPYATDEPHAELWFEQSINAGTYIGAIAYGMHIIVYFWAISHILRGRRKSWLSALFATILFALGTMNIACNIRFNEMTWIDDRNFPGGPYQFILQEEALAVNVIANAVTVVATSMADGLLLYRCFVIWNHKVCLLVIPVLIYLASVAMSILFMIQVAQPDSSLWAQGTINFGLPYWSLSMSLNIILMLMIVSRLLYLRHQIAATLGGEHGRAYTSIAAMIVECALPYSLVSFIFIVLYGLQNTGMNLFIPLLAQVECIAPELIILRVARGRAWSTTTMANLSLPEMQFVERTDFRKTDPRATTMQSNRHISMNGNDISMLTYADSLQSGAKKMSVSTIAPNSPV
ncbi:hypothetical protein WOLCODRAFT_140757 [Wolfiporia cocos MD-104 SS10]|uniref:Uncharacterized protein n=1 Tax=Wolfiporia cocos (strain MD-104) TaxID=742152 RepID=A0A2H3J5F9_WOLCO|nr:hypothetical protein WOLCODRAFT_140757 [Wolfiporia cocos MD-104 SS10]